MDIPGELRLVRDATARLLVAVADLDDVALATDSSLRGWSRADVIRHLTDDARTRAGATPPGDNAPGSAAAAGFPASTTITADLASASEYLSDTWAVRPPDAWGRRLDHMRRGPSRTTSEPAARLVEVAVHHVDLDVGCGPDDLPADVVDVALAHVMSILTQRHARVGGPAAIWRLTRTDAPSAPPDADGEPVAESPAGWIVVRASYGTEIHPVSRADGDADAVVSAPSPSLLFWLLGRREIGHPDLAVSGDAALAEAFPATYPY